MRPIKYMKIKQKDLDRMIEEATVDAINEINKRKYANFTALCEECRKANVLKDREIEEFGRRGKYSAMNPSAKKGFSDSYHMFQGHTGVHPQWRGIVPNELYWLMINATGNDRFWNTSEKENLKHLRRFVRDYIFGDKGLNPRYHVGGMNGSDNPTAK